MTASSRQPIEEKKPLINLENIDGNIEAGQKIAAQLRKAAENTGFFWIYQHGVPVSLIQEVLTHAKAFLEPPSEKKSELSCEHVALGH